MGRLSNIICSLLHYLINLHIFPHFRSQSEFKTMHWSQSFQRALHDTCVFSSFDWFILADILDFTKIINQVKTAINVLFLCLTCKISHK